MQILKTSDWFHPDGFPIALTRMDPQPACELHTHEFSELVIIRGGSGRHVSGRESWNLAAGDVFVISGTEPHKYEHVRQLSLINILYDRRLLSSRIELRDLTEVAGSHALFRLEPAWRKRHDFQSRLRLETAQLSHLEGLVDRLDSELLQRGGGFRFMATAYFMLIVGFLSRCYGEQRDPASQSLLRMGESIAYLDRHYTEKISVDELAAKARMSRRSFLREFKSATGSSPISYMIRLRIRKAAELLRREHLSVTAVAFQVGFHDSNYFSRQFRNITGVTPVQYRRQFHDME